ncbi:acyl-CoA dehydrogenase family protein [Actinomycetospora endophytica]|uniref:Acyl-CoA dehydrogenase family protein n=1 Tax=Actinomycetospora endophytica TaxID=2291215 RepID=A0ABS8P8S2_9PSEU|nr:acyl-CoA dehydrogenase family protein [Actinomycetospora endophytica]MCD2194646.1 acyl-CoA dehydrogenase family protein [Actinomycetospora endophytica]
MSAPAIESGELRDAVAAVLRDRVTPEVLEAAERDGWAAGVWEPLADGGFAAVSVTEAAGGSGGSVAQACAVLEAVGAAAVPVPAAETGLLAGRLLASADLELPDGALSTTSSPGLALGSGGLAGAVARVPWARAVSALALLADGPDGPVVVLVDPGAARITPGRNLAGEPRDHVDLDGVRPLVTAPAPPDAGVELRRRGALSRAALVAGACRAVMDLTVRYTGERVQFGRPVSAFPAVATHLVRIAEQAETVAMAARSAAANAGEEGEPAPLDVAAAAVVASEAAGAVAAAAHQATGAMGMTREFALGALTRRLWSWRDEWGGGRVWAADLGRSLAAGGADAFWPTLSRGLVIP